VLDLLGTLRRSEALRLADRAVQQGWISRSACEQRLARHPNRRGNGQLRILAERLGDGAAAESERILHRLLRQAGITGWVANQEVWADGELVGVVDVALPARRIAVEVDGMAHHVDVDRFRADRAKQNALVALGWTVLRFTWADLTERPGYVVAMLRRLAA
jgi:very-short-patch-repair endonuclease